MDLSAGGGTVWTSGIEGVIELLQDDDLMSCIRMMTHFGHDQVLSLARWT